jgi:hypothetical protein
MNGCVIQFDNARLRRTQSHGAGIWADGLRRLMLTSLDCLTGVR